MLRKGLTQMKSETGFSLIETLVALALLGIVAIAFLGALATTSRATFIANEQATAQSLAHCELEGIKDCRYQYDADKYPVNPGLTIPESWSIPPPVVEPLPDSDDGIQKVTVTVECNGLVVLTIEEYKVDR